MNPRERIIATLQHRKPDRVPIQLGWRRELTDAVMKHYRVGTPEEVERILDADLTRYATVETRWPEFEKRASGEVKGRFGSSGPAILHDERTFENQWGIVQRMGADTRYVEWVGGPFAHTDDLDSFDWPGAKVIVPNPDLAPRVKKLKEAGWWVIGSAGVHPFKQAWHMRGFENFLCDYVTNPEWVEKFYDRILDHTIAVCKASAASGVDQLEFWGDVSMQDRMIVSPDAWRRLDKPAWRRIITETRRVNPDVTFFFHSDGDLRAIIDDIIEVGFNILNPLQPECLNPALVKKQWGDRLTLFGGGSNQRTLPFGTVDDARREADFLMRCCAYNGGYIFAAANMVSFDCPVENVVAFYETARDYDLSTLTGPPEVIPDPPPCMSIEPRCG